MKPGQQEEKELKIKFHGKILEHFGLQAYQSPVAAIAELISNAWDADSESVEVFLPNDLNNGSTILVKDTGLGMTFTECQDKYLNIGYNRRGGDLISKSSEKKRVVLGRKGIGKFAGFGIANKMTVDTVSKSTGERTVFEMNLNELKGDEFLLGDRTLKAVYDPANEERKKESGTKITLSDLTIKRNISKTQFPISMARRFLLFSMVGDFKIAIDGNLMPEAFDGTKVEFSFPGDYTEVERTQLSNMSVIDSWGRETLPNGKTIEWKFLFYKEPINEEELRGVTIFAHGKMAQKPFYFNLSGGMTGQHGMQYMIGMVKADYVDELSIEVISTERQRINFEPEETHELEKWGQKKVKELLDKWATRRGEKRAKAIAEKVAGFSARLDKLEPHEKKVVTGAIAKVASIPSLEEEQFTEIGNGILTAWENGRLRGLTTDISNQEDIDEKKLLEILLEADVLSALQYAEVVMTRLKLVSGLKERIQKRELETAVRDYIADNPWLIGPDWETYKKEKRVTSILEKARKAAKLEGDDYKGRVDLVLSNEDRLLIVEFMQPGLTVDWDHLQRFQKYIAFARADIKANTSLGFGPVTGRLVADNLSNGQGVPEVLEGLKKDGLLASDWGTLFDMAKERWEVYLEILISRGKDDPRIQALIPKKESNPNRI